MIPKQSLIRKFIVPLLGLVIFIGCNASVSRQNEPKKKAIRFQPHTRPLSQLMGINGIWGWGTNKASGRSGLEEGINRYRGLGSWARNYHNLNWDVKDPDTPPRYDGMPGSLNIKWVDWDAEYKAWNDAGFEVEASIQFTAKKQPAEAWNDPYQAAYNYAYAFARHFGPSSGNGYVKAMEVGNEPWAYDAGFYKKVLYGMARGAKDADPEMIVLPCALQSTKPENENRDHGRNYMPARIPEEALPYIDAINLHQYSYYKDARGKRHGTYPEDPRSGFRNLPDNIEFIRKNYPGKKIYLTEWGWDSDGGGDDCRHEECVSELAQAAYAARGLFLADRYGIDRAAWFFYQNTPGTGLYSRCGLIGSNANGALKKRSWYVFEFLYKQLGDAYLTEILREDSSGYAYFYSDKNGQEYIVAWLPADAGSTSSSYINIPVKGTPGRAFLLDGNPQGLTPVSVPEAENGSVKLPVSPVPVVLELL